MADQVLKNSKNQILGKIKLQSGKYVLYNENNHRMGAYDPKTDQTRDANNRLVGKGNILTTLL